MSNQSYRTSAAVILLMVTMLRSTYANTAPQLTTKRTLILTGRASPGQAISAFLKAKDADNDNVEFYMKRDPGSYINSTTLSTNGNLVFSDICAICTGHTTFEVELRDSAGSTSSFTLTIQLKERTGQLKLVTDDGPSQTSGLLRWHVYLILLAVIAVIGVISSLVMYNCCTFHTDIYSAPIRRPNKIIDNSRSTEAGEMNPYARPRRMSLIVKEAVRSGAADGAPYYGVRKSGVWIPTAPEDNQPKGQPRPLRLMSIAEDSEARRLRQGSIAPIRPSNQLPPIAARSNLDQMSWHDISTPRH